MAKLPHQLCALYGAHRLSVIQPLYHPSRVLRGTCQCRIRLTWVRFHEEVAITFRLRRSRSWGRRRSIAGRYYVVIWLVQSNMSGLDQCRLDVEDVNLVQHGFYKTLNSVLGRTVRAKPGDAKRTGC
jgi:hypothetical protein